MLIRPATDADMPRFYAMEFQTSWDSLPARDRGRLKPEQVREEVRETLNQLLGREGTSVFVAEAPDGGLAGFLWFGENLNLLTGEQEAWVYHLSVAADYRRQGVGARLMAHAESHARSLGYAVLGLMVASHNEAARCLYHRLGFEETNVIMRHWLE